MRVLCRSPPAFLAANVVQIYLLLFLLAYTVVPYIRKAQMIDVWLAPEVDFKESMRTGTAARQQSICNEADGIYCLHL